MADMVLTLKIDAKALKDLQGGVVSLKGKLEEVGKTPISLSTQDAEKKLASLRDSVAMWGLAIRGAVDTFQMIGKGVSNFLNPAMEAEQAQMDLGAALRNTGLEVDGNTSALSRNAKELQSMTKYEDDAIVSATALMQNVGRMSAEQLPAAQKAAIGLASAFRIDLETAFELVGKASAGSTAMLGKYGIVLDQSLDAQGKFNQLLDIGASKFSLATEEVNTTTGRWLQFKNLVGELVESLGEMFLPILNDILAVVKPMVVWFTSLSAPLKVLLITLPLISAAYIKMSIAATAAGVTTGGFTAAVIAARTAVQTFLASIPIAGWALLGISAVVTGLAVAFGNTESSADAAGKSIGNIGTWTKEASGELIRFERLVGIFEELRGKVNKTEEETQLYQQTIEDLNEQYRPYLGNLDLEKSKYEDIARALSNVRTELQAKIQASVQAKILEQYDDVLGDLYKMRAELTSKFKPGDVVAGVSYEAALAKIDQYIKGYMDKAMREASQIKVNLPAKAQGGGGSGSVGGTATATTPGKTDAEKAREEYERLLGELDAYGATEREKIRAQYRARLIVIQAGTSAESEEQKAAIKALDDWKSAEMDKITAKELEERAAYFNKLNADQAAYYEEVKFKDAGYYTWKQAQIIEEAKALGVSAEQTDILAGQRLIALEDEKKAWEALPLTEVIERYRDWKAEAADSREVGVQQWRATLAALLKFKEELEKLGDVPGVQEAIDKLKKEIKVAQMQVDKQTNWFWHNLLGFDPESEDDKKKIEAIKTEFSNLQKHVTGILSGLQSINNQRRDEEMAKIDALAAKEKWSDEEQMRRKELVTKKYSSEARKIGRIQQAMSITQTTIQTAESAVAAYKAMVGIPVVGPILAMAASAAAIAAGAVQIAIIKVQKFASGGLFRGAGGPTSDSNLVALSNGEYIVNAASTRRFLPVLQAINNDGAVGSESYATVAQFAQGGLVSGGGSLSSLEKKLDIINQNLVRLDLAVTVINKAPDVKTVIEKHEIGKAKQVRAGKDYSYGV